MSKSTGGAFYPAIVIPAFKRHRSLKRLLDALSTSHYVRRTTLYVSLEGGSTDEVKRVAESFAAPSLDVRVIKHEKRLGLREHILQCGDLAFEHGSVIIVEDDLLVDPFFHHYATAALEYYADEPLVAGISLYAYEYNQIAKLPFTPLHNGFSTYPIQVPCSWGQAWTAEQWGEFRQWYRGMGDGKLQEIIGVPESVRAWPESSWKKYFAAYLVVAGKYFVYPYEGYATNCSDPNGTHVLTGSSLYQVRLAHRYRNAPRLDFGNVRQAPVAYDAYFEPCGTQVYAALGMPADDVEIDLTGMKPRAVLARKPLVVTSKRVANARAVYGLSYRPIEQNLYHPIEHSADAVLILADSTDVLDGPRSGRTLREYAYYAGMPLDSRSVVVSVLRGAPRGARRILRRLLKRNW